MQTQILKDIVTASYILKKSRAREVRPYIVAASYARGKGGDMEVVINKENFESEVLKSDKPVLVDFWATWCGPCAMLAPTIKEIADENPDIKVCKADVDENMELAQQFKISVVPTLLAFKDGKVVNTLVGAESKEQILAMLK